MEMDETEQDDTAPLPGPRGQRMQQLGILTKAQRRKPVIPDIRSTAEGKPNPGDTEKAKFAQTLAEKAQEQKAAMLQNGPAQTIPEADPMKRSYTARPSKPAGR